MLQQAIACFLFISLIQCNQNERSLLQAKKTEDGVIIDKVVFDSAGAVKSVDLINLGDKVALLEGWVLGGTGKLGQKGCDLEIQPSRTIVIMSLADNTTCGIDFSKISKSIQLASGDGTVVSDVEVDATGNENKAMVYAALPTKSDYLAVTEDAVSVLELMQQAGIFTIYLEALKGFGFDKVLQMGAPDPKYSGPHIPKRFQVKPENYSKPEVDWWEGKEGTVAPSPPPPPPPPPPAGLPELGPFTVIAPTDDAFERLMDQLGGFGGKLPKEELMQIDQLRQMIEYHILPGLYATEYLFNNTPMRTVEGTTVVALRDADMVGGSIALHDTCIDKPTPDDYDCAIQLNWGKCWDPFMISPLGAQWQGGFCQRTCERCTCNPNSGVICSSIVARNMMATNGIVHGIDRVLFPPPRFSKEEEKKYASGEIPSYNTKMPGAIIIGQLPEA